MLEVKSLSKAYDQSFVVKDVSFLVPKGDILVLLGTSGCGKTTTLKMINKLVDKSSGEIFIHNKNIDDTDPYTLRRDIGYVIQETGLFPHYNVAKNIAVVPDLLGWSSAKVNERVDELIYLIGLDLEIKNRMPHELSGGQRQRIGLARALAADPSLILLDEPFGALDPITRQEMQREFIELEGAIDKAMVLVTHDVSEAITLGDQICLMDGGKVQQIGSPKQLIFNPTNEFVKAFFANKRLELEPAIVSLSDLTIGLTPETEVKGKLFDANFNLTQVIEKCNDELVSFEFKDSVYNVESVLQTYYQFRKQIAEKLGHD